VRPRSFEIWSPPILRRYEFHSGAKPYDVCAIPTDEASPSSSSTQMWALARTFQVFRSLSVRS